jgi:hypothetical protein
MAFYPLTFTTVSIRLMKRRDGFHPSLSFGEAKVLLTSCDYAVLYLIPKAFNNLGSIFPVTGNPCAAWNARIA